MNRFFHSVCSNKITNQHCNLKSHTVLKLLITVLELEYWNNSDLVGYSRFYSFQCPKMSIEQIFQFREAEKSQRLNSGELIDWWATGMFLLAKKWFLEIAVWQGVLSWFNTQLFLMYGLPRMSLFRSRSRSYRWKCWLIVWYWDTNSLWTVHGYQKINMHLIFDSFFLYGTFERLKCANHTLVIGFRVVLNPKNGHL